MRTHQQAALLLLARGRLELAQAQREEEADPAAYQKVRHHVHLHQPQRKAHQRIVQHIERQHVAEGQRLCACGERRVSSRTGWQRGALSADLGSSGPDPGRAAQDASARRDTCDAPAMKMKGETSVRSAPMQGLRTKRAAISCG